MCLFTSAEGGDSHSSLVFVFLGSCLVDVPSTSCLASAWCCCSFLCSGCSSAVQVTCLPPHMTTASSSSHHRPARLTVRHLQPTTLPGVLTSWPSSSPSENASRSCWCLFPSCTNSWTRRRSATRSSSSTRWITTGEEAPAPGFSFLIRTERRLLLLFVFCCSIYKSTSSLVKNIFWQWSQNMWLWTWTC